MTWFFAILVVALIGGVAVVASGRGGSMAEVFDDRPDAEVPADGPLTAADLRRVRFSTAFRGYRMSEVDALLDRVANELEPHDVGGADQDAGRSSGAASTPDEGA
jgi:DivIVA domain-containing protein